MTNMFWHCDGVEIIWIQYKYIAVMNVNSISMMKFLSISNYKITSPTFKGEHVIQI
jgi:hypothetical protein